MANWLKRTEHHRIKNSVSQDQQGKLETKLLQDLPHNQPAFVVKEPCMRREKGREAVHDHKIGAVKPARYELCIRHCVYKMKDRMTR